jgi:integrase
MLEKSLGLLFFLRNPSPPRKGPKLLFLRITVDGIPKELSLKRSWEKNRWNSRAGRANGTKEDAKSLNAYLDLISAKAYEARTKLIEKDLPITSIGIKEMLTGAAERKRMLLKIFEDHNKEMEILVSKEEYSPGTLERFTTAKNFLLNFIKAQYSVEDINIHSLDLQFVKAFYLWLRTVRNCNHNTCIKYITNVKKIVLLCLAHGWLQNDPWALFDMTLNEVDTVFLTKEELESLVHKRFRSERLAVVRDVFVFCCLTGLAYIDIEKLKKDQLTIGIDGKLWIDKKRQKSKTPFKVPLLQWTIDIIDRYKAHPKCLQTGKLLPVLSNSKYNDYLKEIAALCNINKDLTTHVARHTFATTVTLLNGIPLEVVKEMLGHTSIKQTEHYAKVLPIKVSIAMEELEKKLETSIFKAKKGGEPTVAVTS